MTCQYCRAQNSEEDHRCSRCGRRVVDTPARPELFPVQHGSAATVVDPQWQKKEAPAVVAPGPQLVTEVSTPSMERGPSYQASLFGPQEVGPTATVAHPRKQASPRRARPDRSAQGTLDFESSERASATTHKAGHADTIAAPVAQRAVASLVDTCLALAGVAMFFTTLHFAGHEFAVTKGTVTSYVAASSLILVLYRLLFCLGNGDTPGTQCAGLRLLDFDGRRPTRTQRFCRMAAGLVSLLAIGLGLIWALVDEKHLAWHDYISKTMPRRNLRFND